MNTCELIIKKRDGKKLNKEEIDYLVTGYTTGVIPDYQMASFLMAVYFNGMDYEETTMLTMSMADSGDHLDLSQIKGIKVDKHSTGGVGDKTSLILGPILASLEVPVVKMSGRGLGHTGGTIDKLEGIPGFQTSLDETRFIQQVNDIHLSIVGQSANLAPADKKIYALRDVTGTVDNVSLIAASIMSKKIAAGADAIVLDVKVGSGAFMKTIEDARILAKTMVAIGQLAGRETIAVLTDMNEPLGTMVGNILEVKEAIQCLRGQGEERLMCVTKTLASYMLLAGKKTDSLDEAKEMVEKAIRSGRAFEKMKEFIEVQGGDTECIEKPEHFEQAKYSVVVTGKDIMKYKGLTIKTDSWYLAKCNNQDVGMASLILGGGRQTKDSSIDMTVGLEIKKHLGEKIGSDECLAIIYGNDEKKINEAKERLMSAYELSEEPVSLAPIIYEIITKNDL